MRALNRKLGRDLRQMWSQALTIALVVASGIGGFITSLSAVDSLALARDDFYADARFADLFAAVKRALRTFSRPSAESLVTQALAAEDPSEVHRLLDSAFDAAGLST